MTFLLSLAVFFPKLVVGFEIANTFWKERTSAALLLKLALGVPIGLWLGSSLFFLSLLAGVPPDAYSQIEFWGGVIVAAVLAFKRLPSLKLWWRTFNFSMQHLLPAAILVVGVSFLAGTFLYYARLHPYGFEDAWSIWNLTARYLYRSNSSDVFINSGFYPRFHPDYPVELGLNIAWGWFVLRSETTRIPMALAFLATCTPVFLIWAVLRRWEGIWAGVIGALVVSLTLDLPSAVGQYADALLTLHMLGAAAMMYEYFQSQKPGLLVLAGVLAGSAAWVKNEGLLFLAVISVVCLLAAWKKDIQRKDTPWFFIGAVLPLVIVFLYKSTVNIQNDLFTGNHSVMERLLDVSRWQVIGLSFGTHILDFGNWPVSAVLLLVSYALLTGSTTRQLPRSIWLLTIVVGQLAGYFFIYLITPHDLKMHINTSIDRLISHVFPLIVFWLLSILRVLDADIHLPEESATTIEGMDKTHIPSRKDGNGW